jgi:hypothetical protein
MLLQAYMIRNISYILKSKHLFWGHNNQWFSEDSSHLSSENMEEVGSSCTVHNLPIGSFALPLEIVFPVIIRNDCWIIITHLEISFKSG